MVKGTATNTVACVAAVRLYLWETVARLWPQAQCFTLVSGCLIAQSQYNVKRNGTQKGDLVRQSKTKEFSEDSQHELRLEAHTSQH
jgi:hypothetical protein